MDTFTVLVFIVGLLCQAHLLWSLHNHHFNFYLFFWLQFSENILKSFMEGYKPCCCILEAKRRTSDGNIRTLSQDFKFLVFWMIILAFNSLLCYLYRINLPPSPWWKKSVIKLYILVDHVWEFNFFLHKFSQKYFRPTVMPTSITTVAEFQSFPH